MNIFESNSYNMFMYVSISVVLLLIFFNFVDIVEEGDFEDIGLIISYSPPEALENSDNLDRIELEPEELYSEKSYLIYYSLLGILGVCIFLLSSRHLLSVFKDKT